MCTKKLALKISILTLGLLFILPSLAQATGPSYAKVELFPLAISQNNEVLFGFKYQLNSMGAATFAGTKYGWLAASPKGVWDEAVHYEVTIDDDFKKVEQLDKEFKSRKDLNNPTPKLKALIDKYKFNEGKILSGTEGKGEYTWSPTQFCHQKQCSAAVEQVSLGGLKSQPGKGTAVKSSFAHKGPHGGFAVFANQSGGEEDEAGNSPPPPQGAEMAILPVTPQNSFESTGVDGIVLLK